MKKLYAAVMVALIAVVAVSMPLMASAPVTLKGEIIDSVCWVKMGAKGADHRDCAQECADGGIPLALLDEATQQLVWVTSSASMKGANEELKAHASHTVELTGEWAEREGTKIFVISEVTHISAN